MDIPPALLQFLGSLVAIVALAGIARWLGLGPAPCLANEEAARRAAQEAVDGFCANDVAIDRDGKGAILRDSHGRILLLRPHGAHFAGRILGPAARASTRTCPQGRALVVASGERRFGESAIVLADPETWAARINAVSKPDDA